MTYIQSDQAHRINDEQHPSSKSVNDQLHSLAEILDDLDPVHASVILSRMTTLAQSIRYTSECKGDLTLSRREHQVLVLVGHGYTRRDIALSLGISFHTAARHIANIYSKLGICSVAEATAYALQHNLILLADKK